LGIIFVALHLACTMLNISGWPKQDAQLAMTAIGQNLRGTTPQPANTGNRIKPDHQNRFARCKAS